MKFEEILLPLIKNHRRMWVEMGYGDMPPTVMAMRGGKVIVTVTSPQIDKVSGLRAAALCRDGLSADALMVIYDTHVRQEAVPEGMTPEESLADYRRRFPPGSMQRMCDEEGACEVGPGGEPPLLSDALACQYHDADSYWMKTLLYKYDSSRAKSALEWADVIDYGGGQIGGGIFSTLRNIVRLPRSVDSPGVQSLRRTLKLTEEDTYVRLGRSAVRAMTRLKYLVFVDKDHTELVPEDCRSEEFGLPKWYKE